MKFTGQRFVHECVRRDGNDLHACRFTRGDIIYAGTGQRPSPDGRSRTPIGGSRARPRTQSCFGGVVSPWCGNTRPRRAANQHPDPRRTLTMTKRNPEELSRPVARLTCSHCHTRLDVFETSSGGRTIAVAVLTEGMEPKALEHFIPPGAGPDIQCPACTSRIDPSAPRVMGRPRRPQ
jgi:hypothetical protein